MRFLKQSTASQVRTIGPFVDDGDFKTLENGLTIANTDILLKKNGGASAAKNSGGATADTAGGMYHLTFDATDTGTVGELFYSVKVAGALVVFGSFWVLEEAIYDALYGASAAGFNSSGLVTLAAVTHTGATIPTVTTTGTATAVTTVNGLASGVITAASIASDAITAAKIADGAIDAATFASGAINAAAIAADAIGASELAADAAVEIASAVWDRVITAANHNVTNSAGKRLREITNSVVTSGTAQAGSTNTITLASAASSTDGIYDPSMVRISGGTGAGQARLILHYTGSTRVAIVDRDWRTAPDSTSEYEVLAAPNLISTNEGLAQGGGASTITLNASASSINDTYVGETVVLRTGTGQDQSRLITAYNGTTKVATVAQAWVTQPTSSSAYMIWPLGRTLLAAAVDGAITAASIASDAFTAAKFASDVTTEFQNGLATAAALAVVDGIVDDILADTAVIGTPAGASIAADLAAIEAQTAALGTADDAVLAAIAALNNLSAAQVTAALDTYDAPTKAEFDAAVALLATAANLALVPAAVLTAATANPIDANVQEINDTALTGDGNSTPWGPAA